MGPRCAVEGDLHHNSIRRHRDRRWAQRPRDRGLSRTRGEEGRRPRASVRPGRSGGHGRGLSGIQVHRLLVRLQPHAPTDHPRPRPPLPRIRGDPARIELHPSARRTIPVPPRRRGGRLPGDREVLPPGRGSVSALRPPHGEDGEVHRADPLDDAAEHRLHAPLRVAQAPRPEQAAEGADGGRAVHIRAAHDDERCRLPRRMVRDGRPEGRAVCERDHRHLARATIPWDGLRPHAPLHGRDRRRLPIVGIRARRHGDGERIHRPCGPDVRRGDSRERGGPPNPRPKRTFLKFLERSDLPADFVRGIENFKIEGSSGKVNLALKEAPSFSALPGNGPQLQGAISLGPSVDYIERAYDDAKYGNYSHRPYVDMCVPSTLDPTLAPPRKHLMSCFIQYPPYTLRNGTWEERREAFGETVIDTIEEYIPDIRQIILHKQVLSPWDLEQVIGLTGGNIFHGELTPDQLLFLRPVAGWAQYRTPIKSLYLCGSGAHPGGGVMGAPGMNAAREILRDWAMLKV